MLLVTQFAKQPAVNGTESLEKNPQQLTPISKSEKKQTHACPILYYERVTNNTQTNLKNTTNINVTHNYGMNKAYN